MTYALRLAIVVLTVFVGATASAQSLGAVANQEEARRKGVQGAGKVYTNESLRPEPPPSVPPTPGASTTPSSTAVAAPKASGEEAKKPADDAKKPADDGKKSEPKKDEAYWKQRVQTERDALERARAFGEALQSRINALTTDFTNRDDPAQRNKLAADRQKALAELERLKKEIEDHTKTIADLQEEARRTGVPAGWLR
jgi:hypothetical protein